MRAAAISASCLALLSLAACGAGDGGGENPEEEARQVVRDFARARTDSDGEKLCGELMTREVVEQTAGATGDDAEQQCERQIDSLPGRKVEVTKIADVEVRGDTATVVVELEVLGQPQPRTFRLKREDGKFRLLSQ